MQLKHFFSAAAVALSLVPIGVRASGELRVTELMYDAPGADSGYEWVEFYNASGAAIPIVPGSGAGSWRFSDGSSHVLRIVQGEAAIPAGGMLVVAASSTLFLQRYPGYTGTLATSSFSLPNAGGTVGMTADGGATWLAQLTYLSAWGGSGDGSSLEKAALDGPDDASGWRSSPVPGGTPGQPPSPEAPNAPPVALLEASRFATVGAAASFSAAGSYDPDGDPLTLSWDFGDGESGSGATVTHVYATAGQYTVQLTASDGLLQATATASVTVINYINDGVEHPVAGTPPVASIAGPSTGAVGQALAFSGAGSYDEDSAIAWYSWNFGDGGTAEGAEATHAYSGSGAYTVTLVVSDGAVTSSATSTVSISGAAEVPAAAGQSRAATGSGNLAITEALPNPVGEDATGEYVEVLNIGGEAASLAGWAVADARGRAYQLLPAGQADVPLEPGSYRLIPRLLSGLTLPNASGSVQLLRPGGAPSGELVRYASAPEGKSWSLLPDGSWAWARPTPGAGATGSEPAAPPKSVREVADGVDAQPRVRGAATSAAQFVLPSEAQDDATDGDGLVEMVGVVTMPPGIAGKRLLYVADYDTGSQSADSSAGIGVYVTSGAVPKLEPGDIVSVSGRLGSTAGERQLKVGSDGSISVVGKAAVEPAAAAAADLGPGSVGSFVSVSGEVSKSSGKLVTIDDGSGEVAVWFPSNGSVAKPTLKVGQQLSAAGVVRLASDGSVRVAPRDAAEVQVAATSSTEQASPPTERAQARATSTTFGIVPGSSPLLPLGLAAAGAALAGAIWWARRGSKS